MSTPYAPDPFAVTNVSTLPAICEDAEGAWEGFRFVEKLDNETFYLPDVKESHLPGLEAGLFELKLDDVSLPSLDASSVSEYATADEDGQEQATEHAPSGTDDLGDIWALPSVKSARKNTILTSWDHFLERNHTESGAAYVSEAGADVFDAIVQTISKSPVQRLKPDIFLDALCKLAMGRPSLLFTWNAEKQAFIAYPESYTVTGLTPEIVAKVVEATASSGALFKTLRRRQSVASDSPSVVAFDASLQSCLAALEMYMEGRQSDIVSMLALQSIYQDGQLLLILLDRLKETVQGAHNNANMVSEILRRCASWTLEHPKLTHILNGILAATMAPVLEQLAAKLGFVGRTEGLQSNAASLSPLLNVRELLQVAKETHESLDLLQAVAPQSLAAIQSSQHGVSLRLAFSWDQVHDCQQRAVEYEAAIRASLFQHSPNGGIYVDGQTSRQAETLANQDPLQRLDAETYELCQLETSTALIASNPLQHVALSCLRGDINEEKALALPLDDVVELSLSPIINAQHRLLSYAILSLLFTKYRLQSHLQLLQQFHLFADGTFAARLSMALFDNELASGEGQRRTGATTGLRLHTRDSWPPASSELRLALMSILSDSLRSSGLTGFEESMSFAIRDLSDDQLDLCRDVNSIHALDFLKIHYKAPNAVLEAVFSSESLEKYDRIFTHILRVLRLKSVAQGLLRTACPRGGSKVRLEDQKLHVEIHHFVSVVADYCHNVAIAAPWTRLQRTVDMVEGRLKAQDYDSALQYGKGLEQLRELHRGVLDDILGALLLKQKETKAMAALEEIFGLVLCYAASLRRPVDDDDKMNIKSRLRDGMGKLVRRFIDQVVSITNRGATRADSEQELDPLEQLLLRLDFSGYWTSKRA